MTGALKGNRQVPDVKMLFGVIMNQHKTNPS